MALRGFIGVGSGRIQNDVILSRRGGARFFEAPAQAFLPDHLDDLQLEARIERPAFLFH